MVGVSVERRSLSNTSWLLVLGALAGALAFLALLPSAEAQCASGPPPNDCFASAVPLGPSPVSATQSNVGATQESGEPQPCGAIQRTIWYTWTPAFAGTATIDTYGSGWDTVVAAYTGTAVNSLSLVACNDDNPYPESKISFSCSPGTTYNIQVGGWAGSQGTAVLNVRGCNGAPECSPLTQTVNIGQSATLSAVGVAPYTWTAPGSSNPGPVTGSTFTASWPSPGTKTITVTNSNGMNQCKVIVRPPPLCGYTITTTATQPSLYNWEEIAPSQGGSGTPVPNQWYYTNYALTMSPPFDFSLCGDTFTTMRLAGAGHICFDNSNAPTGTTSYYWSNPNYCGYYFPGNNIPSTAYWMPNPAVFGLWGLVNPGYCPGYTSSNCLFYEVQGQAPNRVLIYEFLNAPLYDYYGNPGQTFEIKLFEASDCIEVHFKSTSSSTAWPGYYPAASGYQSTGGQAGYQNFRHTYYSTWQHNQEAWQACPFGAVTDTYTFNEDQPAQRFDVSVNDNGAGQPFSVTSFTLPSKGTLTRDTGRGNFTYEPHDDAVGTDSFTYTIRNAAQTMTATGTVLITINPVNDAPTFVGSTGRIISTPEDGPQVVPGWASSVRPGPLAAVDEVGQGITFVMVSNSEPAIFASDPTLQRSMDAITDSPSLPNTAGDFGILRYSPSGEPGQATVCFSAVDSGGTATSTNSFGGTANGVNLGPPQCADILLNAPPTVYFEPSTPAAGTRAGITFNPCPGPAPKCTFDRDGVLTAYLWEFGDGGSSAVDAPSHAYTFPGTYAVRLTVWDDHGVSSSYVRNVDVIVADAMAAEELASEVPPVPDAGEDRTVLEGSLVQLEGSQEGGGDATLFLWEQVGGPTVVLSDASSRVPEFRAPLLPTMEPIDLIFGLRAEHHGLRSEPDYVTIRVVSANRAPVADAGGAWEARVGDVVTLGGPNTGDPDGDALTYRWEHLLDPGEAVVSLSDAAAARPTFTASKAGSYEFRLTVSDGKVTAVDIATVSIRPAEVQGEDAEAQAVRGQGSGPVAAKAPETLGGLPPAVVAAGLAMLLLAGALALVVVRRLRP